MPNLPQELTSLIEEFKNTVESLAKILGEDNVADINEIIARLENLKISIAVFGETNAGKSALLNSLLGKDNNVPEQCPFAVSARIDTWSNYAACHNGVPWTNVAGLELVIYDTPGIAGDMEEYLQVALEIAKKADFILYVVYETIRSELQVPAMESLLGLGIPILVVINKIDIRRESEIVEAEESIRSKFSAIPHDMIVRAAGHPIDGSPQIDPLVRKIINIVEKNKHELIIKIIRDKLHKSSEEASRQMEKIIREQTEQINREIKNEMRRKLKTADILIYRYAMAAAISAGVIPFGIDAATSAAIGGSMFVHIANVYEKKFDYKTIGTIFKDILIVFKDMLFVSAATLAGYTLLTVGTKTNPATYFVGMVLDGIFTKFIVSAIGQIFSKFCAEGKKWDDFKEKRLENELKIFVKNHIKDMLIDKIPEGYRKKVIEFISKDLLPQELLPPSDDKPSK